MADDGGAEALGRRGFIRARRRSRPAGVHRVIDRTGSASGGGSDSKVALIAGFGWALGRANLCEDLVSYLYAGGMRSKVLVEARNWPVAWRSFVDLSGGRLGFDRVESDRVLKARFRSLYVRAALNRAQALRDGIAVAVASILVFCCCIAVLVAAVAADASAAIVAAVTAIAVLFVAHRSFLALLNLNTGGRWSIALAGSLAAAASVGAATWLARHWLGYDQPFSGVTGISDARTAVDAGIVIGLLGLPIAMAVAIAATSVASAVIGRWRMRRHPDVMLFGSFVEILEYLGRGPAAQTSLAARRRTAQSLECAARAVEYGLRHALRLPDSRNDAALRERLYAIASAIRAHQVSFVLSEKAALVELSKLCVRSLRSVCSGALGSLAVAASPASPAPAAWRQRVIVVRAAAVPLAPITAVLALAWRGILADGAFGRTVVVGAASWAVLSSLALLDPLFADRLKAIGLVTPPPTALRNE